MKILLVEDSIRLQRSLCAGLKRQGFSVDQAFDGEQAQASIRHNNYDTIILDLALPKVHGLEVLSGLRASGNNCQVLILSANDQTEDRIRGLDLGADDYMVKPFSFDELVSRLRALTRRQAGIKNPNLEIDGVEIDTVSRKVTYKGLEVNLTPHEYKLLEYLALRRGRVFSHDQLIDQLYDAGSYVTRNAVEAYI